jgi:hypothetical protein
VIRSFSKIFLNCSNSLSKLEKNSSRDGVDCCNCYGDDDILDGNKLELSLLFECWVNGIKKNGSIDCIVLEIDELKGIEFNGLKEGEA